jgi:hypothetical protein
MNLLEGFLQFSHFSNENICYGTGKIYNFLNGLGVLGHAQTKILMTFFFKTNIFFSVGRITPQVQ